MNTMTELLMTEINAGRIAERHADAAVRRLAAAGTPAERPARGWSIAGLIRRTTPGTGATPSLRGAAVPCEETAAAR